MSERDAGIIGDRVGIILDMYADERKSVLARGLCPLGCSTGCGASPCEAHPPKEEALDQARRGYAAAIIHLTSRLRTPTPAGSEPEEE